MMHMEFESYSEWKPTKLSKITRLKIPQAHEDRMSHCAQTGEQTPGFCEILGIRLAPMTIPEIIGLIESGVARRERYIISSMNFHGLYVYGRDATFRMVNRRSFPRIDGISIVWLGRLFGRPLRREHRVTWLDLIEPLLKAASACGWRLFYLGGEQDVVAAGLARIRGRYPALNIEGHHGYVRPESAEQVRERIQAFDPDILIVGMGMSVQERWILENEKALQVPVIATAGACIEYIAGAVKAPPRWLGPFGLEWLYRLTTDPKRFWRRYLIEPWAVLLFLGARLLNGPLGEP